MKDIYIDWDNADEAPEKKIEWGDYVMTPDGKGRVTELDGKSEYRYLVSFDDGTASWYIEEEIAVIKDKHES